MKVAVIGVGGLGSALAAGLLKNGNAELVVCDRHPEKLAPFLGKAVGVSDPVAAVAGVDVAVLAVKPRYTVDLARSLAGALPKDALVASVAAGVAVGDLPGAAARAMPSVGAAAGASTTAIFLGAGCVPSRDRPRMLAVFGALGPVRELHDEGHFHAATALTASGPAWVLLVVDALVDAGVEAGLSRTDALAFARGAAAAAVARLDDGVEPTAIRAQITSPGGTTAAGLAALERGAVRAAFADAVRAAVARSKDIAK